VNWWAGPDGAFLARKVLPESTCQEARSSTRAMVNRWTPERRARQAALIRTWRPWERSTGPRTPGGKARSARNAYKGGHRNRLRQLIRSLTEALEAQRDGLPRMAKPPKLGAHSGAQTLLRTDES